MSQSSEFSEDMFTELNRTVDVKPEKSKTPGWARRIPRRTIVLGVISGVAVVLYFVVASLVASATSPTAGGLFAAWRMNILSVVVLWTAIITGASSLWTWLLHVRDREFIIREIMVRTQASKRN